MTSYREIYDVAAGISPPTASGHLSVEWVLPGRLAVGRDVENRHLLLLGGCQVQGSVEAVRRILTYSSWHDDADSEIEGTLLRLHAGEQFMMATTAIAIELVRRGVADRPIVDVFPEVECFIELVIRRVLLPAEFLLGLVGELLVFDYLLDALSQLPECRQPDPCAVWQGQSRQSRDFRLGRLGLEVKTTAGPSSRHRISGLDQVDPRIVDGELVEALFLVSVGLREDVSGTSRFSVAALAESIVGKLDEDASERFLEQLAEYGPDDCAGYDHATMCAWEPYVRGFTTTFSPRVYDMSDERVLVIRRASLQQHFPFVMPEGLSFTVQLPDVVPGSHGANPRTGLAAVLGNLVEQFA